MKIFVLIKQVPDTETRIKVDGSKINEAGVKWIVSPFDEHAIEEALKLREKTSGHVTAITLGPDRGVEALRTAFALGVDRAIHIKDDSFDPFDISYAAGILSVLLKKEGAEMILSGHTAIDSQSSMVPVMIAELLGCANISNAIEVHVEKDKIRCKREIEGGTAFMEAGLPVVITAAKNLNSPRYPSLKGIMSAKKKELETVAVSELSEGVFASRIEVLSLTLPPERPAGRTIEGATPQEKAKELVKLLREEAKVI